MSSLVNATTQALDESFRRLAFAQATLTAIEDWCQRWQTNSEELTDPAALLAAWHQLRIVADNLNKDFQPIREHALNTEAGFVKIEIAKFIGEFDENLYGMGEVVNGFLKTIGLWGFPELPVSKHPSTLGTPDNFVRFWSNDDQDSDAVRPLVSASIPRNGQDRPKWLVTKSIEKAGQVGHSVAEMITSLKKIMNELGKHEQAQASAEHRGGVATPPAGLRPLAGALDQPRR